MTTFEIEVEISTVGKVVVNAQSQEEAERIVQTDFGVLVNNAHTSNDKQVMDWDVPLHPEKTILSCKLQK